MKTKKKRPHKVCYFTFVTLFVRYACQLKMEYIHKKNVDTFISYKISEIGGECKEEREKKKPIFSSM
jgi:hypothetical protein